MRQFQKEIEELKKKLVEGNEPESKKNHAVWITGIYFLKTDSCRFKMLFCAILGEEISGSEGSGSEEMDEGDDEGGEAGEGRRRKRGRKLSFMHTSIQVCILANY